MNFDVLAPPKGFEVFDRKSPLIDPWRPIYAKLKADRLVLGLFVTRAHMNSRSTVHAGLYASLADWAMGLSCGVKLRAEGVVVDNLWTTSLTVDYLGKATAGQWLTFDTGFVHTGKTLCRAECDIAADWETVARAHGAFRVALAHVSSSS